jgi:hypothetical protein
MLKKALTYIEARIPNLRQTRVISRFLCYFGVHKMRIGLGWSGTKRFDTCYHCSYYRWVEDIEGNKKIDAELQKLIDENFL